jgi:hypothetical protein
VLHEFPTQSTDHDLEFFVDGLDVVIKRDLDKHKSLLEHAQADLLAFEQARSHEIQRKRVWKGHIGGGKFNDDALRRSIKDINQNINHFSRKIKTTKDRIAHHTRIVDTLAKQLKAYREQEIRYLARKALERRNRDNASDD